MTDILKYDQNDRAVYRNEDVPHEEDRNVYCPNPCKFKDTCWNNPCIERKEINEIKAIGQICFRRLDKKYLTCEQIESAFTKHMPSYTKIESSMVDDHNIQLVWSDNVCPVQLIRDIIGDDLSSIKNLSFDTTSKELNYSFHFECYDDKKSNIIKEKYSEALQKYFGEKSQAVLKVSNDEKKTSLFNSNFTYFYFEFEDLECYQKLQNFCEELNIELEF